MQSMVPLLAAIAVCSAGVMEDTRAGYREGQRWFYMAGDNGRLRLVDALEPADLAFIAEYTCDPANNGYTLYTRTNPSVGQVLVHGVEASVRDSFLDFEKVTVFLAHGWNGDGNTDMNKMLTDAFLQEGDVNVIVLDWSRLANRGYVTAKGGTAGVGRGLGQFVLWLAGAGLCLQAVHLVGFSLGGHLVGNAGRAAGGAVARVTALDPAGPLWLWDSERVQPADAAYVEVLHTNTLLLGYSDPCGDADFYPNGGSSMPGCWLNSCSHSRAYEYMASAVKHDHLLAQQCDSLRDATRDRCTGAASPMGNAQLNKLGRGIFRVNTGRKYPY